MRRRRRLRRVPGDDELEAISDQRGLPMVVVTWTDAATHSTWAPAAYFRAEAKLVDNVTVGHLVSRGDDTVMVALNANAEMVSDVVVIPAGWVKSVKRLRVA